MTRNMVRIIASGQVLQALPPQLQNDLETFIDLNDSGNTYLEGCYQAIFARNHESRQTPELTILQEMAEAEKVFAETQITGRGEIPLGYWIERLTPNSDRKLIAFYEQLMVSTFGDSEVRDLLPDPDAVIIVGGKHQHTVTGGVYAWKDQDHLIRN